MDIFYCFSKLKQFFDSEYHFLLFSFVLKYIQNFIHLSNNGLTIFLILLSNKWMFNYFFLYYAILQFVLQKYNTRLEYKCAAYPKLFHPMSNLQKWLFICKIKKQKKSHRFSVKSRSQTAKPKNINCCLKNVRNWKEKSKQNWKQHFELCKLILKHECLQRRANATDK